MAAPVAANAQDPPAWVTGAWQLLHDNVSAGFAILDRDLRYVKVNPTLAEINGVPVDAHLGRTRHEVVPDLADASQEALARVLATGEPLIDLELSGTVASTPGQIRHWLESAYPVPGPDGSPVGLALLIREVTDLRLASQEAVARQAEAHRLHLLHRLAAALVDAVDTGQVAQAVADLAVGTFGADVALVTRFDGASGQVLAVAGPATAQRAGWQAPFPIEAAPPVAGMIGPSPQAVSWNSRAARDRRFPPPGITILADVEAAAIAPLLVEGRSIGCIGVGWYQQHQITPPDVDLLVTVAAQATAALERARLFDAERLARHRLRLLGDVSARLACAADEHQQLSRLVQLLLTGEFAAFATVYLPDEAGNLRRRILVASDSRVHDTLQHLVGTPMAGDDPWTVAWQTGRPARFSVPDPGRYLPATGVTPAVAAQIRSVLGAGHAITAPLVASGRQLGVFVAWRPASRTPFTDSDLDLLAEIGRRAGQAIDNLRLLAAQTALAMDRARLVEAERVAQRRLRLLGDVSAQLASAADEHQQLSRLVRLLTGEFAACSVVYLPDEVGTLHRRILAATDPRLHAMLQSLVGVSLAGDDPWTAAWHTGQPQLIQVPDPGQHVPAEGAHPELAEQLRATAGAGHSIAAPLVGRGRPLGMFVAWRPASGAPFDDQDLQLLADLGHRAGKAIDNLRLLAAQTRIATRLQATLLPATLPTIPGLELDARYLTSDHDIGVGGDFYDVFPINDGYVLVIGDVAGRGVDAAGLTGIARTSLRALADHLPPPAVLARMNTLLLERAGDSGFLTLAFLLLHPHAHGATVHTWLAGHPPPTVVHPDGTTTSLGTPGQLLGILPEVTHHQHTHELAPGDLLLLYTDGLTEARGPDGQFGPTHLPAHLARLAGSTASRAVDRLAGAVTDYRATTSADDTALLAVRLPAPADRVLLDLPVHPTPAAITEIRRQAADTLTPLLAPERATPILAAIGELLSHAPRAATARPGSTGTTPPRLRISVTDGDTLRVEVAGPAAPTARSGGPGRQAGRPLRLPALAGDPTVTAGRAPTGVWFETRACLLADPVPVHDTVGAALVALTEAAPPPRVIRLRLAATVQIVPATRHLLEAACRVWNLAWLVQPATLVFSELVTNAVRHAGGDLDIHLAQRHGHLCLAVGDGTHTQPVLSESASDPSVLPVDLPAHGRGMHLVDAYATAWGCNPTPGGKTVWATLRTPPPASGR